MTYVSELPACMGGFCQVRESCARFHASNRAYPSERLCSPHRSDVWQPIASNRQTIAEHHTHVLAQRERAV